MRDLKPRTINKAQSRQKRKFMGNGKSCLGKMSVLLDHIIQTKTLKKKLSLLQDQIPYGCCHHEVS